MKGGEGVQEWVAMRLDALVFEHNASETLWLASLGGGHPLKQLDSTLHSSPAVCLHPFEAAHRAL